MITPIGALIGIFAIIILLGRQWAEQERFGAPLNMERWQE